VLELEEDNFIHLVDDLALEKVSTLFDAYSSIGEYLFGHFHIIRDMFYIFGRISISCKAK
jgi:hypothetical protein